jgi:hypothetical protein
VPRATHNMSHTERFELKSLPGGFVVLRRLNYEQYLERQAMAMEMRMSTTAGQSADRQIAADIVALPSSSLRTALPITT